jgi:hypothetical protein
MSFLRHEEIYRSDVRPGYSWERQPVVAAPALIGCDEFPVGYSLAGCPPAAPASASPTGDDSQQSTLPYNDFSANGNYPLNFVSQFKGALHCPFPRAPIPDPAAQPSSGFESSLEKRLFSKGTRPLFRGSMKPKPGDISIVDKTGTFLMWYDNW